VSLCFSCAGFSYLDFTDFEPNEAAAIVLDYKLSDSLNEGQIQQISNDMLIDKISEEYPEIAMQAPLYHINQLLLKRTMKISKCESYRYGIFSDAF
jgi:hypothetical protein